MIYVLVMILATLGAAGSVLCGALIAVMGFFIVGPMSLVAFLPAAAGCLGFIAIHEWAEREYFQS